MPAGDSGNLLYAHTVLSGLRTTDDRTFVTSFAAIDRAIINPVFMLTAFFGPLVALIVAAFAFRGTTTHGWVLLGLVLYVAVVILTVAVNVLVLGASGARSARLTFGNPQSSSGATSRSTLPRTPGLCRSVSMAVSKSAMGNRCVISHPRSSRPSLSSATTSAHAERV